jgi:hypothetical protein
MRRQIVLVPKPRQRAVLAIVIAWAHRDLRGDDDDEHETDTSP